MGSDSLQEKSCLPSAGPRTAPLYGEFDIAVLGGRPAGIAAAAAAAALGRKVLLIERYGFRRHGHGRRRRPNFCGLHANVFGDIRRVVHGVADDLLGRIDTLGGLNTPHMIFGKTKAQAYDTAALQNCRRRSCSLARRGHPVSRRSRLAW